jgi:hypothetical protein
MTLFCETERLRDSLCALLCENAADAEADKIRASADIAADRLIC